MKTIPILNHHDYTKKPLGVVEMSGGRINFRFYPHAEVTKEMMFEIFGGAGISLTEYKVNGKGETIMLAGRILEFSYVAKIKEL